MPLLGPGSTTPTAADAALHRLGLVERLVLAELVVVDLAGVADLVRVVCSAPIVRLSWLISKLRAVALALNRYSPLLPKVRHAAPSPVE